MNFSLQYLDGHFRHIDVDVFDQFEDAIEKANTTDWAFGFNLIGMDQRLSAIKTDRDTDGKLNWRGYTI